MGAHDQASCHIVSTLYMDTMFLPSQFSLLQIIIVKTSLLIHP